MSERSRTSDEVAVDDLVVDLLEADEDDDQEQAAEPRKAEITADILAEWSWPASRAKLPQLRNVIVTSRAHIGSARLVVEVTDFDDLVGRSAVDIEVKAGENELLAPISVPLDTKYMAQVLERHNARCEVRLETGDPVAPSVVAKLQQEIDIAPRNLWYFRGDPWLQSRYQQRKAELDAALAEIEEGDEREALEAAFWAEEYRRTDRKVAGALLSAFVRHQDLEVAEVAREAAVIRGQRFGEESFHAFQLGGERATEHVLDSVRAIYLALQARNIAYSEPPPGWDYENAGQIIRDHAEVARSGLGTCMDTTVLFAAVLEQVGLLPVMVQVTGHIFVGFWLQDPSAPDGGYQDWYPGDALIEDLRTVMDLLQDRRLGFIETTVLVAGKSVTPDQAMRIAEGTVENSIFKRAGLLRNVDPSVLESVPLFRSIVDVVAARRANVSPLPTVRRDAETVIVIDPSQGAAPHTIQLSGREQQVKEASRRIDPHPARYRAWKAALAGESSQLLKINAANEYSLILPPKAVGRMEDLMYRREFELRYLQDVEAKDAIRLREDGDARDLEEEDLIHAMEGGRIHVLPAPSRAKVKAHSLREYFAKRMDSVNAAAKRVKSDSGVNPLHLAIGTVKYKVPNSKGKIEARRAPVVLMPVTLAVNTRNGRVVLARDPAADVTPNLALADFLRKHFGMQVDALSAPPEDDAGLDIPGLLDALRAEAARLKLDLVVTSEALLTIVNFSSFQMLRDLQEHAEVFLEQPLIKHLVFNSGDAFVDPVVAAGHGEPDVEHMRVPLPADSAQLRAIGWAQQGRTFVMQGPPGTGKSQTIANMIGACLTAGMKVLFVAEKQTALEAVQRGLFGIGLDPYALNLHDEGLTPVSVRAQLKEALAAAPRPDQFSMQRAVEALNDSQYELERYPQQLHERNSYGLSAYRARNQLLALGDGEQIEVPRHIVGWEGDVARRVRTALEGVKPLALSANARPGHPWRLAGPQSLETFDVDAAVEAVIRLLGATVAARVIEGPLGEALAQVRTPAQLELLAAGGHPDLPGGSDLDRLLSPAWSTDARSRLSAAAGSANQALPLLHGCSLAALELDLDAMAADLAAAQAGFRLKKKALRESILQPLAELSPHSLPAQHEPALRLVQDLATARDLTASARGQVQQIPGLADPSFHPLQPAAFQALYERLEKLERSARPLQSDGQWAGLVRGLAVDGHLRAHHQVLADLALAWFEVQRRLSVGDGDLSAWLGDQGLLGAVERHGEAWAADARYQRLIGLQRWTKLANQVEVIRASGFDHLRDDILDLKLPLDQLLPRFDRGAATASLQERLATLGLDLFDSVQHEEQVERHVAASRAYREQWKEWGPEQVWRLRPANKGLAQGAAATKPLEAELAKNRNRLSNRALLARHAKTIQDLAPAFLMSPVSVVNLLNVGQMHFDVVIFDEASQVRVHHAIGAIGRAGAVVVVGDSKQMPPTKMIGIGSAGPGEQDSEADDDAEGEEALLIEDQESILNECELSQVPTMKLKWHYRSQDESLIAFSNRQYYEGRLVSFPTPSLMSTRTGLEFRLVDGGRFVGRTNQREAEEICRTVRELAYADPDGLPSVLIVTMNAPQKKLIETMLRDLNDRRIAEMMTEAVMGKDDFLAVKSLEEVQGDQRDHVLLSVAFAPGENGKLDLSWGPMTQSGADRRLNVAVTRAKLKMLVFCSFRPSMMELRDGANPGMHHVKEYLSLAAEVTRQRIEGTVAEAPQADSESAGPQADAHLREIAESLRANGYQLQTGVGLSDFKLDILLTDPDKAGRPVLPILLDGESWISRKTVGDRDVLPVEVLKRNGWPEVLRIWWPMWVQNRDLVLEQVQETYRRSMAEWERREQAAEAERRQRLERQLEEEPPPAPPTIAPPAPAEPDLPFAPAPVPPGGPRVEAPPAPPMLVDAAAAVATDDAAAGPAQVPNPVPEPGRVRPAPPLPRGLAPYTAWQARPVRPVLEVEVDELADVLEEIVRAEGPMVAELAYRRYIRASGGNKMGGQMKTSFNKAAYSLVRRRRLATINDATSGQQGKTLYVTGGEPVVLRSPGDRVLDKDVPRSEVQALLRFCGMHGEQPTEPVMRKVLQVYNLTGLTASRIAFLQECAGYRWR